VIKFKVRTEVVAPNDARIVIEEFPVPLTNDKRGFEVKIPSGAEPWISHTATTGMRECIGNVIAEDRARGYVPGDPEHVFPVRNPFGLKKGARCYITEHLKLDGKPEYLVTQHRILQGQHNFVNVGYEFQGDRKIVLMIDVITGETRWV
jgi:hypothetical protein